MSRSPNRRRPLLVRLVMILAAIGLFLLSYQWGNRLQFRADRPPTLAGVLILPPQPLPAVTLHASAGQRAVTRADLTDHWTLLAFASPASAAGQLGIGRMIGTANRLAGEGALQARLRLWLVSADDAPNLALDFERLTPMLMILTGAPGDLDGLRGALGLTDANPGAPDAGEQPALYLIDPQARLVALFPGDQPADAIATDLLALSRWPGLADAPTESPATDADREHP